MNARQKQAQIHARVMRTAKEQLLAAVNRQIDNYKRQGYYVEVTPQVQRLLDLGEYRQRDVQQMNKLVASPEKLNDYIFAVNQQTGEAVSGEKAMVRYSKYRGSKIAKPAKQLEVMVDNVADTVSQTFVDYGAMQEFETFIQSVGTSPDSAVPTEWWQIAHPNWFSSTYRGDIGYGQQKMVQENSGNIYDMRDALQRLIESDGEQEAAKRIAENYNDLQEASIIAAIGYKNNAASALQTVLRILLPSGVRSSALRRMASDMEETIEGQFDYADYEE